MSFNHLWCLYGLMNWRWCSLVSWTCTLRGTLWPFLIMYLSILKRWYWLLLVNINPLRIRTVFSTILSNGIWVNLLNLRFWQFTFLIRSLLLVTLSVFILLFSYFRLNHLQFLSYHFVFTVFFVVYWRYATYWNIWTGNILLWLIVGEILSVWVLRATGGMCSECVRVYQITFYLIIVDSTQVQWLHFTLGSSMSLFIFDCF